MILVLSLEPPLLRLPLAFRKSVSLVRLVPRWTLPLVVLPLQRTRCSPPQSTTPRHLFSQTDKQVPCSPTPLVLCTSTSKAASRLTLASRHLPPSLAILPYCRGRRQRPSALLASKFPCPPVARLAWKRLRWSSVRQRTRAE